MADTTTNNFNDAINAGRTTSVVSYNEVNNETTISDEEVPLSVIDQTEEQFDDEGKVTIEDEDTPLAVTKSGLGGRIWWYWILIIISLISGKIAESKKKKYEKKLTEDTEE